MKTMIFSLCAFLAFASVGHSNEEAPPSNTIEYARWARETKDLTMIIKRLEDYLKGFIPLEDGAKVETEYEGGSIILAVTGSAWVLARAYVEAGQKDKAVRIIDWLQEHDSKSDIFPKKTKIEQVAPTNGPRAPQFFPFFSQSLPQEYSNVIPKQET